MFELLHVLKCHLVMDLLVHATWVAVALCMELTDLVFPFLRVSVHPRSGASMTAVGDMVYLFGGQVCFHVVAPPLPPCLRLIC